MRVILLAFMVAVLWGQSTGMVIELQHINPGLAAQIANAYGDGKVKVNTHAYSLILSGPPEALTLIQGVIRKADVPAPAKTSRNVELTFYVLAAGDTAVRDPLPEDLAGVAKQVKGLLGVSTLRMMESIQIRSRERSSGEASGILGKSTGAPNIYTLRFNSATVADEGNARTLRISGLKFGAKVNIGSQYIDTGFSTDIDLKEGQKIVIGKSSLDTSGTPYFVVVTGKVVD